MHVSTQEEARGSLSHPEETHFRLVARDEGSFPCFIGKEFPAFPSNLKRRRSPQERRGELQGPATIPRVPQISQSIPEEAVFPALPRLSCRGSTHNTVARGRALWESLLGKPPGKATDPLSHMTGSVTLQLQLGRKVHVHAPTRDEGSFHCVSGKNSWGSRRISRGGALHRKGERNSRVVPPFQESPRYLSLPGSSLAGSREFDGWTALRWKDLFIY